MPSINIMTFRGERPRVVPRLLDDTYSTVAQNTQFERGMLQSYLGQNQTADTVPASTKTLFRYEDQHWFTWQTDVDAINSPVANDDWKRVYFTGDGYPKVTNNQIFNGAVKPAASYRLGVPADTNAIVATVVPPSPLPPDDDPNDDETRFYTHTYVTQAGEEGPPAPPSNQLEIRYPASTVNLVLPGVPTNQSNIDRVRIYRSVTTGQSADFLFVTELPVATVNYTDSMTAQQLGPALVTDEYVMPDEDMRHLTLMSNGIVAGAWGNTVAFCEPYLPYAWPTAYQLTTEHEVVAMESVGSNLVVATTGYPWIFYGVTSDAMAATKVESLQACVSKRSMVNVDGVVVYASPDGLVGFNGSAMETITSQVFTRRQWQAIQPETIEAYYYEGHYLAFYGSSLDKAFLYSLGGGDVTFFDQSAKCGFSDLKTDSLYLVGGQNVNQWDAGQPIPYRWRSKEYHQLDSSYTCALVRGDTANIGLRIFVDGSQQFEMAIGTVPSVGFRLPMLRGRVWQFEIFGTGDVQSLSVATSMAEVNV